VEEAAGKVRIVASVDYLSQLCLHPIHDWMETVLKALPSDSTFDQDEGLRTFLARKCPNAHSLDLSAATDRIPQKLYRIVFSASPLGKEVTQAWMDLLVDRDFYIGPSIRGTVKRNLKGLSRRGKQSVLEEFKDLQGLKTIRYSTGQPMGMLSSWSSMAIVHHFLVQFCFWKMKTVATGAAFKYFPNYTILGDDVVIGDSAVAEFYTFVLKELGVKISEGKSYQDPKGCLVNFSSRTFLEGIEVSPLSLKEVLAVRTLFDTLALGARMMSRGYIAGAKSLGEWKPSTLIKLCTSPFFWKGYVQRVIGWNLLTGPLRVILLLWFLPGVTVKPLWTGNQTLLPLANVLNTEGAAILSQKHALKGGTEASRGDSMEDVLVMAFIMETISQNQDFLHETSKTIGSLFWRIDLIPSLMRKRFHEHFKAQNMWLARSIRTMRVALKMSVTEMLTPLWENNQGLLFFATPRSDGSEVVHAYSCRKPDGTLDYSVMLQFLVELISCSRKSIDFRDDDFLAKLDEERETKLGPAKRVELAYTTLLRALESLGFAPKSLFSRFDEDSFTTSGKISQKTNKKGTSRPEGNRGSYKSFSFADCLDPFSRSTRMSPLHRKIVRKAARSALRDWDSSRRLQEQAIQSTNWERRGG